MNPETLAQTLALAEALKQHIDENNINDLWYKAHVEARAAAGATGRTGFFDAPYAMDRVDYALDLTDGLIYYTGTDRDNDHHSFAIDPNFICEETRPLALTALREHYEKQAARERANAEQHAAKQRARDEADYERLARTLGKVND